MKSPRFLAVRCSDVAVHRGFRAVRHATSRRASPTRKSLSINMKTLAGTMEGPRDHRPPEADMEGKPLRVSLRVTSRGNALVQR